MGKACKIMSEIVPLHSTEFKKLITDRTSVVSLFYSDNSDLCLFEWRSCWLFILVSQHWCVVESYLVQET